ncbi:MAG: PilZ domain-containing protein [Treponema sp.]|nr:PilZ domain-containing protein [Treponema sp.]
MATPVGRIEKEFLLRALIEEKLPIMYIKERNEYVLTLEKYPFDVNPEQGGINEMIFRHTKPLGKLKPNTKIPLLFNYRGQVIDFSVDVITQKDNLLICKPADILYKNLDRNYLRVDTPSDLKILFTFRGDRYNLSFPRVPEYETIGISDLGRNADPKNLSNLIKQITHSLKNYADGFKIVNFKDKKPDTMEERIVSETGKTLFIPSTTGLLPKTDPYPKKRIITEDLFKRYLETTGVGPGFLDDTTARFLKNKADDGFYSDAWVPILFHEYVIGYIHIWIDKEGRLPFDFSVLDSVYQFAKVLAFSLKENGYFEHGRMHNDAFEGKVLDISASGLLFAYPLGTILMNTLLLDAELTVTIEAPYRTVSVIAKIVRKFKDKTASYFGCRFINMAPEDMRFLFEHLYGRQIDASDTEFLAGQV